MALKPRTLQFRDTRRVLNAMELMSDIISIGDLVLMYRHSFLEWLFKNEPTVRAAVGSTVEFTCNLIMKEVGLLEWWGPVGSEVLKGGFKLPRDRPKKYGYILFILTATSQLFLSKKDRLAEENTKKRSYYGRIKRWLRGCRSEQDTGDDPERAARGTNKKTVKVCMG